MTTFVAKTVCQRLLAKDEKRPPAVVVIPLHITVITVTPWIAADTFRAPEVKMIAAANTQMINTDSFRFRNDDLGFMERRNRRRVFF